jgi:hypothetical protein
MRKLLLLKSVLTAEWRDERSKQEPIRWSRAAHLIGSPWSTPPNLTSKGAICVLFKTLFAALAAGNAFNELHFFS